MFDRIVIRRTTPHSSPDPLDLGRLAETMLFYRKVHLTVSRAGLDQLLRQCGPAVVIDLVENWNVDFAYLNADIAVRSEGVGTPRMRHQPVTITNLSEPHEQWIVRRFQEVVGRTGAGRRLANRFLKHARPFALTTDLVTASRNDWEDEGFVERAIAEVIRAVAPTYQQPETLRFKLVDAGNQYFSLDSNINWTALERARVTESTDDTLTPGHLLLNLATMREEIQLAAALGAQLATDALGWALIKTKCADLLTTVTHQQAQIEQFHDVVVDGVHDLRTAINSGQHSFVEFLGILNHADRFRSWLDKQTPDAGLVRAFQAEASKDTWLEAVPTKIARWATPLAVDFALQSSGATGIAIAGTLAAVDQLALDRLIAGWRPGSFIDRHLRPFVN